MRLRIWHAWTALVLAVSADPSIDALTAPRAVYYGRLRDDEPGYVKISVVVEGGIYEVTRYPGGRTETSLCGCHFERSWFGVTSDGRASEAYGEAIDPCSEKNEFTDNRGKYFRRYADPAAAKALLYTRTWETVFDYGVNVVDRSGVYNYSSPEKKTVETRLQSGLLDDVKFEKVHRMPAHPGSQVFIKWFRLTPQCDGLSAAENFPFSMEWSEMCAMLVSGRRVADKRGECDLQTLHASDPLVLTLRFGLKVRYVQARDYGYYAYTLRDSSGYSETRSLKLLPRVTAQVDEATSTVVCVSDGPPGGHMLLLFRNESGGREEPAVDFWNKTFSTPMGKTVHIFTQGKKLRSGTFVCRLRAFEETVEDAVRLEKPREPLSDDGSPFEPLKAAVLACAVVACVVFRLY